MLFRSERGAPLDLALNFSALPDNLSYEEFELSDWLNFTSGTFNIDGRDLNLGMREVTPRPLPETDDEEATTFALLESERAAMRAQAAVAEAQAAPAPTLAVATLPASTPPPTELPFVVPAEPEVAADAITDYNNTVSKKDKITYTDYVGLMMSSVTTIVNVISYVLIAFVSVSLIVSSIMIGIITYISVLERTKEIGILRAMGASKHNVSQVFNAETGIIGLCSGLLGVGLTVLLNIPINAVLHHFIGNADVNAALPVTGGVVLVILSVVLTLIGGLIPSRKAAKQDPATALRTE